MRNGSTLLGSLVARNGPISAGGYVTGGCVADDDTQICRLDTQNAYYRGPAATEWTPFFRPGPTVGVDDCNILSSSIWFDPAGQGAGLGNYTWGRTGSWDVGICATDSDVMACHSMFNLYGTIDGGATLFKCTNFPQITSEGMNPNNQGGAWGGNRTRGRSLAIDPINPDHVLIDTTSGVYRSTNFTSGAASTWTLISTASLPARTDQYKRNQICFDRSSAQTGGKTQGIYVMQNDGGLYKSTDAGVTWAAVGGTGAPTHGAHLSVHPTTGIVCVSGSFVGATQGQLYRLDPSGPTWTAPASASAVRGVIFSSQNAAHWYTFNTAGQMFFSSNSGVTWVLCPQNTGAFVKSAPNDLWHEFTTSGLNIGDVVYSPTQARIYMYEGLGCWYCDSPPTSNLQTPTWAAQHEGISNLVAMGCEFTANGDLLIAGQDKPGWVITKEELDAGTNATRYAPSATSLRYAQTLDWAKSDPNFFCFAFGHGTKQAAKSTDRGATWATMAQPAASLVYGNILALTPDDMLWIPGANSGQPHITQDGGATWTAITIGGIAWTRWHNAYNFSRRAGLALEDGSGYVIYCHGINLDNTVNTSALGFWKIAANGTATRLSNSSVSIPTSNRALDFYDGKIKEVPGEAGNFFWSGGNNATGLYKSTNLLTAGVGSVTWTKLGPGSGFSEVLAFGFGAPVDSGDYPIIRCAAWGNDGSGNRYGWWESEDGGSTWSYVSQFIRNVHDMPLDISGDRNKYGRWCIAYSGKGIDIIDYDYAMRLS